MIEVRQTERYVSWFKGLRDRQAQNRINIRIRRLSLGNLGDVKPVGEGVSELRINYGPGYRVYFVQKGPALVILMQAETNVLKTKTSKPRLNWLRNCRKSKWQKLKPIVGMRLNILKLRKIWPPTWRPLWRTAIPN